MKRFLFLPLLAVCFLGTAAGFAEEKSSPRETKTVHMRIEGMTCSMCAAQIQKKLSNLCSAISIDHKTGHGQCTYETGKTTPDAIAKTVTDAGYTVVEVR